MRHAPTIDDMSGTHQGDHQCARAGGKHAGDTFGHRAVPQQLRLAELAETLVGARRFVSGLARMLRVALEQEVFVRRECRGRARQACAFFRWQCVEADGTDLARQVAIDVERHHRHPVHAGEVKDRQVHLRVVAPVALPVGGAQQFGFGQVACHPAIERRLRAARKHLETEDQIGPPGVQRCHGLRLPAVVLPDIVPFTEQHHRPGRQAGDEVRRLDRMRGAGAECEPTGAGNAGGVGPRHRREGAAEQRREQGDDSEHGWVTGDDWRRSGSGREPTVAPAGWLRLSSVGATREFRSRPPSLSATGGRRNSTADACATGYPYDGKCDCQTLS